MAVLIDTHAFLWYMAGDPQLSSTARVLIDERSQIRYVSTASLCEISIKYSIGRLVLVEPYETLIPRLLRTNGIDVLTISLEHLAEVANMAFPDKQHKDPFDRLIMAQSRVEKIPVVSIDARFDVYDVNRLW